MYYAHIRDDGALQTVSEHLNGTSVRCEKFAEAFGEGKRGALIGMAHDIGKNSKAFQKRLQGGPKVDHATAGAVECCKIGEELVGCCVVGHHSGLPDYGSRMNSAGDATYIGRIKKGQQHGIPDYEWYGELEKGIHKPNIRDSFMLSFWVRMLFSCLVDADYLATEAFMNQTIRPEYDSLPVLLKRLNDYIAPWFPAKNQLNEYRCQILNRCLESASMPRGVFSLTVPTGGGKTASSLAFALKHAVENGLDRVIYVIPYTSIIEQNAQVFRDILGEQNVIEHHCDAEFDSEEEVDERKQRQRMACENWDAPVIVTTAVQFFESLYSNRPSKCRKLHNIANSVIIFDEAQMIPGSQLKPCVGAISALVSHFRATAVLCTATQPVIEDILKDFDSKICVTEICPQVGQVYEKFQRVTYCDGGTLTNQELAMKLSVENQVLCIVNSRKMAQDLFELLPIEGRFHLSTLMYPDHRTRILEVIRKRLRNGLPCRVISTSLIEAGVDVDFPTIYRQMTGLDSLIQAAGRCNREGKRNREESIVIYFEGEQAAPLLQQLNIGAAEEVLKGNADVGAVETIRRYFSTWRSLVGENIDKADTVNSLKNGNSGSILPFQRVAEKFHMIDQNTKTVYIPVTEAEPVFQRMTLGIANRADYRQAGKYSVNVYEDHFKALVASGDVQLLDESGGILMNLEMYHREKGLSLKAESGKIIFL